jgi:hypothetical protein
MLRPGNAKHDVDVDKGTPMAEELGASGGPRALFRRAPSHIRDALGFSHERRPILIGIDGLDGSDKSSLAAWLSWQLEMPAIHLDLYIVPDTDPLEFRTDHLATLKIARLQTDLERWSV